MDCKTKAILTGTEMAGHMEPAGRKLIEDMMARYEADIRADERERCAQIVEATPVQIYRDEGIGSAGRSCKPASFDDVAKAIRNGGWQGV